MEVVFPYCAGLDVHKKRVTACRLVSDSTGQAPEGVAELQTFGTMTHELLALADWLVEAGVTHVAMESTGEYWKPVSNLLEGVVTIFLVNASHVKNVPGRKTDPADARWLAKLMRYGLLQASFIPPVAHRDLRDLTRYRTKLVQERAREANRLQGVLERANIKLASVASDVLGVSGRAMLEALIAGQAAPAAMAALAKRRMRSKLPALEQALTGRVRDHHRHLLTLPCVPIRPHPVHDFLAVPDERQHGEHRLDEQTVLPLAALTQCASARIARRRLAGPIPQDSHASSALSQQPRPGMLCPLGRGPRPLHPAARLVQPQTECAPDHPPVIREACAAPLLGTAACAPRRDPRDPGGGDAAAPRRGGQADLRPVLRRLHAAQEPGALGELRTHRPRGACHPARAGPGAHALARVEQPQRDHLTGPAARRGRLRNGAPRLIDRGEPGREKSPGGPTALRSGEGGHTAPRGGVV